MSIGQTLAAAREERGLTLRQVSDVTRLRVTIVSAMENDNFDAAGGAVYARGHIRAIARAVGADGEALVAQFDVEHAVDDELSVTDVFEVENKGRRDRRGPNWSAAMAAALVAAIAVLAFQLIAHNNSGGSGGPLAGDTPTVSTSSSASTSTPPNTTTSTPSPSSTDSTIAQLPPNEVTLRMSIIGTASWVQVTNASGAVLYTGTLTTGQTKYFRDNHQLSVVIGNAAAVDLVVNGQDLGTAGSNGQVLHQTFRPGDPSGSAG